MYVTPAFRKTGGSNLYVLGVGRTLGDWVFWFFLRIIRKEYFSNPSFKDELLWEGSVVVYKELH